MTDEGFDFRRAFVKLIERTGDPVAPIKLQEAHRYANAVGKMLARQSKQANVTVYTEALLSFWPDEDELTPICGKPEFICALASMLCTSLERYAVETHDGVTDENTAS